MKPFFSVIIPSLNEELFLPKLLSCLSKQSFTSFEVILVDGTSEDNTLKKAKTFLSLLPTFRIYKTKTRNVAYQRNFGGHKAKGNYLVFFDADVLIPDDFLDEIFKNIVKNKYELMTTYLYYPRSELKKHILAKAANISMEISNKLGNPTAGGFNILVRKSLFLEQKGFREDIVYGEDHDFVDRCYKSGSKLHILKLPKLICSFRRYDRYGYLKVIREFIYGSLHARINGPITKHLFEYPMGGEMLKK